MIESRNGRKILVTPISPDDLQGIHIGDILYLDGDLITCRDSAHRRVVDGTPLPVDARGYALLHAGPIVRSREDGSVEMLAMGPTTSMRMEKFERKFVELTGIRLIIGKGGMGSETEYACQHYGCLHCVIPAGNAVMAAVKVEEVIQGEWYDLGMPEMVWHCRVKEFGPLIVSIDREGHNLFERKKEIYNQKKEKVYENICQQIQWQE